MKKALARTHQLGRILFSFSPPFITLRGRGNVEPPSPSSCLLTPDYWLLATGYYQGDDMNLTEMEARVREDLQDTDEENYRWTDDEVDGAIQRAVLEYSIHAPIEQQTDIATTDGSTELDISGLSGLLQVASVEFPIGQSPKYMQHFECYAGHLYMEDEGDGSKARVRWLKIHTLDESSTIPAEHEEIIILGATGYLAMSAAAYTVDRATIAGHYGTINYKAWAKDRLDRYDRKLKDISLGNRVTQRQLYTDDD